MLEHRLAQGAVLAEDREVMATAAAWLRAGRQVADDEGEVDGVVSDYQRIVDELRENEEKLLRLNEEISNRADSLEQFNDYLLSSIESGMITITSEGKVLSINRAAARMLTLRSPTPNCWKTSRN